MAEETNLASRIQSRFAPRQVSEPRPFLGLIDPVVVPGRTIFDFDGAIAEPHAQGVWIWMVRDIATTPPSTASVWRWSRWATRCG